MKKAIFLLFIFSFISCHSRQTPFLAKTENLTIFKTEDTINKRMPSPDGKLFPFISVVAAGDIMIGNHTIAYMERHGYAYPFEATSHILHQGDITFANLEIAFTDSGEQFDKRFTFKVHPKYATGLVDAGIDVVTLANNHILDYGLEGLNNTITILDSIGILHCGAGMSKADAQEPAIFETNGHRIAVFGYSMTFPKEFWATDSTGGTNYPYDKNLKRNLQKYNSLVDLTVVTFHWGKELSHIPKGYQKRVAHRCIDLGADLVLGHHPHVLQGFEIYKNRLIAYSLGNYAFSSYSTKAKESMILKTCLTENGLLYAKIFPISVDNYKIDFQPRVVTGAEADSIFTHLREYSHAIDSSLVIDKNGYIWGNKFMHSDHPELARVSKNRIEQSEH